MRRIIGPVAIVLLGLALSAVPAEAHDPGTNPHVHTAHYKQWDDLGVRLADNVSTFWQTGASWREQDSWLGPPPDMHWVDSCSAHPNWACISVQQVNRPGADFIFLFDPDGADGTDRTGFIRFNIGHPSANETPGRHWSCLAFAGIFGLARHTNPDIGGCTRSDENGNCSIGGTCENIHVAEAGRDALRDAYRRGEELAGNKPARQVTGEAHGEER